MKTSIANETPILNALTRPYLVQSSDRQTLEEHAEALVKHRVTHVESESIMRHVDVQKVLDQEAGVICPLPGGVWLESTWPFPIAVLAKPHPLSHYLERAQQAGIGVGGEAAIEAIQSLAQQELPGHVIGASESLATQLWIYGTMGGDVIGPTCECWFVADPQNDLQLLTIGQDRDLPWIVHWKDSELWEVPPQARRVLGRAVTWTCRTFSFMNASGNVAVRDGGFTNDHVSRKRRDAEHLPWIRRKVLKLRRHDGEEEDLFPRDSTGAIPLHLRRGHFVRYGRRRPDQPDLRFWRRACLVGNAEAGVVVKDYELEADEPAETPTGRGRR